MGSKSSAFMGSDLLLPVDFYSKQERGDPKWPAANSKVPDRGLSFHDLSQIKL
jgi:hypothetical protein